MDKNIEQVCKVEAILNTLSKDLPIPQFYGLDNEPAHDEYNGQIGKDLTFNYQRWNRMAGAFDNCAVQLLAKGKNLATITKKRYVTALIAERGEQIDVKTGDTTMITVTSAAGQKHPALVTTVQVPQADNGKNKVTKVMVVHHAATETATAVIDQIYDAVVSNTKRQDRQKFSKLNIASKATALTADSSREL